MKKKESRYLLVRKVAKLAQQKAAAERNPIEDQKNQYMKTINDSSKLRKHVLEAHEELLQQPETDDKC